MSKNRKLPLQGSMWGWVMVGAALVALAVAQVALPLDVIEAGSDAWATPDNQNTWTQFDIAAGEFCNGSPLSIRINLKGVPLASTPAGAVGEADTIIERLDDAVFSNNLASTQVLVRAVSLASSAPVTIGNCLGGGPDWDVAVAKRPLSSAETSNYLTSIDIARSDANAEGGTYSGTLAVPARLTFTSGAVSIQLDEDIDLMINSSEWSFTPGDGGLIIPGGVMVDTDGDGEPDEEIPASSNFAPGWSPACACPAPITEAALLAQHGILPPIPGPGPGPGPGPIPGPGPGPCFKRFDDFEVFGTARSSFAELRNVALSFRIRECDLLISDVLVAQKGSAACNSKNLTVVNSKGSAVRFKVASASPCIIVP